MSDRHAAIMGLGCAAPETERAQGDTLALSLAISPPRGDEDRRLTEAVYRKSGIERRGVADGCPAGEAGPGSSVAGTDALRFFRPATEAEPRGPSTAERMAEYARRAGPLAERASRRALADAGVQGAAVTHLVTASCTGFSAPGWDIALMERLGLSPSVLRTHLGFMGCHAAINALRVAQAFALSKANARVLVCCTEVCSIHFRYAARPDQIVANALFADGSASALVAQSTGGVAKIASTSARLFPGSTAQMGWTIGDHGFDMTLGADLPATIREHGRAWLGEWLDAAGVGVPGVRSWAVHPGGPRILSAVGEAADLPGEALRVSREVLAAHGNMSSPTVLFILERLRGAPGGLALPTAMLSFGPGVAAEGALLG